MRNIILFVVFVIILFVLGRIFIDYVRNERTSVPQSQQQSLPINHEYYWSQTCPHCANVAQFLESWDKKDRIVMDKFEINQSNENALKFVTRGDACGIPRKDLGVPLLITPEGACLSGDEIIIEYLKGLEL